LFLDDSYHYSVILLAVLCFLCVLCVLSQLHAAAIHVYRSYNIAFPILKEESNIPEPEVYRDPTIVRSDEPVDDSDLVIQKSKTTSKMINVFRQLEEQMTKEDDFAPRPLKQFTPPREPIRMTNGNSSGEEDDVDGEEEEEDDEETENMEELRAKSAEDQFLKEVGVRRISIPM